MKKRVLIIAVIAIIAMLGVLSVHKSTPTQPSPNALTNFDFEILYTAAGFVPSILEVPMGSRVAFRNTTDTPLWTASDPHPMHTDYTEFDARMDYASDRVYIFRFDKTGTFGFHNHERSIDRGVIHVFDPAHPAVNIDKTIENQRMERDKLLAMFDAHNTNSIFKIVDTIQADPVLSLNCHDIAHDLGHRAYELYGFSEAMAFNNPNHVGHALVQYICAGGYMHGILEELSLQQPEFKTQPGIMCATIPDDARASCFHGIGHVFMFANSRDVPSSLAGCRSLDRSTDTYRCFEGVWMEMFWGNTAHVATSSLGWDLKKPMAPCISTEADAKPTCFLYSTFGYLRTHPKDYSGAVQMCTQSDLTKTDTEFCLKGLGITMMSKFKGQHLEGSEIFVEGLSDEQKRAFYQGVMGYARLSGLNEEKLANSCDLLKYDKDVCIAVLKDSK